MVVLPIHNPEPEESIYAKLGLKDLPFPVSPISNPYSDDDRCNGAIYAESPVQAYIRKFEDLLIKPNDFRNRARLAYLWSRSDQESGRGMGKTALLRYFRHRINQDWGITEFGGRFSALVVYVSFPNQVDRRYMEQLALSALVDICKCGVLDASRAVLRLKQLSEQQVRAIVTNADGSQDPGNLLKDEILRDNGVEPSSIDAAVTTQLRNCGIQSQAAEALSQGRFEDYLRSFRRDNSLEPLYVPRDTKILDFSRKLLFDDIVLYLREAGFQGGYLFMDDIENLVDKMTRRHTVDFAKEFALGTLRPAYAAGNHNFFSCVLTTHMPVANKLANAWTEAGLSGIARLSPNDPNSVELPLPSANEAREIIIAHLDYYRINPADNGTASPFTEDGIRELLKNSQHPRILLGTAARVVSKAAQDGVASLDAAFVNSAKDDTGPVIQDFSEGIGGAV